MRERGRESEKHRQRESEKHTERERERERQREREREQRRSLESYRDTTHHILTLPKIYVAVVAVEVEGVVEGLKFAQAGKSLLSILVCSLAHFAVKGSRDVASVSRTEGPLGALGHRGREENCRGRGRRDCLHCGMWMEESEVGVSSRWRV